MNKYYISIKATGLSYYINNALILPADFYNKERPKDIQNLVSDYILLSKDKYLNDSDSSIEIILTNEEVKNYLQKINDNLFLYSLPIPLSRVSKIFFLDENKKKEKTFDIEQGNGFIPTELIEVKVEDSKEIKLGNIENFEYNQELKDKIKKYDQILGGIAFARYDINGEYFGNYFSLLSYFNNLIKGELDKSNIKINDRYKGAFDGSGKWRNIYPFLYKQIEEKDVLNQAENEKIKIIKTDSGLWDISNIKPQSWTYFLAILNNYGEDSTKRKNTESLLNDFKNQKIFKEKQEGISLIYGINNGYSKFFNKYDKKIVKFKMDSLLDYYTVESIYQYVFNNQKENYKFDYLDKNIEIRKKPIFNKRYETYQIMDETVIIKNKKTIITKIEEFLKENLFLELEKYIDNLFKKIENLNNLNFQLEKENFNLRNENDNLKQEIFKNQSENRGNSQNESDIKKLQQENNNLKNEIELFKKRMELEKKTVQELKKLCQNKNIAFSNKDKKELLIEKLIKYNSKEKTLFEME